MQPQKMIIKTSYFLITATLTILSGCGDSGSSDSSIGTVSTALPGNTDNTEALPVDRQPKFVPTSKSDFLSFESGHVRPLAISSDGKQLYAVNTPDNHLEIFTITPTSLIHTHSVAVGLEPVAVNVADNGNVWVVNHLSDSVSVINTSSSQPFVERTLQVGDEPRDIVFAGTNGNHNAFITTAHRGQNSPWGPDVMPDNPGQSLEPGVGRADVWVFDANLPGTPSIHTFFTDTPRSLTISPDKTRVYVAGFHTGNQTTTVHDAAVCDGGASAGSCNPGSGPLAPGGLPAPNSDTNGNAAPEVGLIVKYNGSDWVDETGRDWSNQVNFNLPDSDVFEFNANTLTIENEFHHVGTVLYNMVTHPVTGKVYVSNTEANNLTRFEGTRLTSSHSSVIGNIHKARITIIDPGPPGSVTPRHLNKHIDYSIVPSPAEFKNRSLATPTSMTINQAGSELFVAAFGSSKVGRFNVGELDTDSFIPAEGSHISVSGGGPSGLLLNEDNDQLYVFTRFDNGISIVDTNTLSEVRHYTLPNPEPQGIVEGRPFLYDASLTSSNGEASCSSCHVFADFDSLAWDLGDPEGTVFPNPNVPGPIGGTSQPYHPMKGPMTTQSLRGMAGQGPMHWRGDRTAGSVGGDPMDEFGAFKQFNGAFVGLLGNATELADDDINKFAEFILQVQYPPNPNRPLDNSLTPKQLAGSNFYFTAPSTAGFLTCNTCHVLDPSQGFFGTNGQMSFEGGTQEFKIPHLRNMYQKIGMFGIPRMDGIFSAISTTAQHMGDQVRGFGFVHDGSIDTLKNFHRADLFSSSDTEAENLAHFMYAMDNTQRPIVGQQTTISGNTVTARLQLMINQMVAGNSELIAKASIAGQPRGWFRQNNGLFQSDDAFADPISLNDLLQLASTSQPITFTAVPLGTAIRTGVDRDNDLVLDANDNCPGTANENQADSNGDGIGDACPLLCEGDFDNDGDVDGIDATVFSADFGRLNCTPSDPACEGDFDADGDVDGIDANLFSQDFGRLNCPTF